MKIVESGTQSKSMKKVNLSLLFQESSKDKNKMESELTSKWIYYVQYVHNRKDVLYSCSVFVHVNLM